MKKKLALLLSSALLFSALTACAPKVETVTPPPATPTPAPTEQSNNTPEPTPDASDTVTTITFWNFPNWGTIDDTPGKYERQMADAFEAKNPNIKVNVEMLDFNSGPEKITTAIAGGTAPDVIYDAPGRIITWGKDGVLAPLNDMFTPDFVSDVSENVLKASKVGDTYWMYPTHSAPFMMAFNKGMLEKHGLLDMVNLEGDRAWTLDQYDALIKALKEKGETGAVIFCSTQGGDQGTRAYLANLYGGSTISPDLSSYTTDSPEYIKALEYVNNAIKEGLLLNGSASDGTAAIDEFALGRVSHTILFSPGLVKVKADLLAQSGTEPLFLPFPSPEKPKLEFLVGGLCVFNNKDAARIEASKKFIDFIANDPEWSRRNVEATGSFPVRFSVTGIYGDDPNMAYNESMSKYYGTYYNTVPGFAEMRQAWFPTLQAVFGGEVTPEEGLKEFTQTANATLKK